MVNVVQGLFREIGLRINPTKSSAIVIEKGTAQGRELCIENDEHIASVDLTERIKYLGCSFSDELQIDEGAIRKL